MLKFIVSLILMSASTASASEYKYTCFDIYNLYGNLRYSEFTGQTDFDMLKNMISGGDSGTLSIALKGNKASIHGFDEKFYDGYYGLAENGSQNGELSLKFKSKSVLRNNSTLTLDLKSLKPSDAPEDLMTNVVVYGWLNVLTQDQNVLEGLEVVCGVESIDGVKFDWNVFEL